MSRGKLKIFACRSGEDFANLVVNELNKLYNIEGKDAVSLAKAEILDQRDGEIYIKLDESVRDSDVYVVQCLRTQANEKNLHKNLWELMFFGSAVKCYGDKYTNVTAIIPYMAYARQDGQRDELRETYAAVEIADHLKLDFDGVITMDIHSKQQKGFWRGALQHINSFNLFTDYLKRNFNNLDDITVVSPDGGGVPRVKRFANQLKVRFAVAGKIRLKAGEVEQSLLTEGKEDIPGKIPIIIDDMVDSGGTIKKTIERLLSEGSKKSYVMATHGVFSDPATEILSELHQNGMLEKVIVTNTIPYPESYIKENPWLEVVCAHQLFTKAMKHLNEGKSISDIYNG